MWIIDEVADAGSFLGFNARDWVRHLIGRQPPLFLSYPPEHLGIAGSSPLDRCAVVVTTGAFSHRAVKLLIRGGANLFRLAYQILRPIVDVLSRAG